MNEDSPSSKNQSGVRIQYQLSTLDNNFSFSLSFSFLYCKSALTLGGLKTRRTKKETIPSSNSRNLKLTFQSLSDTMKEKNKWKESNGRKSGRRAERVREAVIKKKGWERHTEKDRILFFPDLWVLTVPCCCICPCLFVFFFSLFLFYVFFVYLLSHYLFVSLSDCLACPHSQVPSLPPYSFLFFPLSPSVSPLGTQKEFWGG